jgi:hypothetical protein
VAREREASLLGVLKNSRQHRADRCSDVRSLDTLADDENQLLGQILFHDVVCHGHPRWWSLGMKQADARSHPADRRAMGLSVACVDVGHESARSIGARRHIKLPSERPREHFVAPKTAGQRDSTYGLPPCQQQGGRLAQAKAHAELLRGFTGSGQEQPMQMERRELRRLRQRRERHLVVESSRRQCHRWLRATERHLCSRSLHDRMDGNLIRRGLQVIDDSCGAG